MLHSEIMFLKLARSITGDFNNKILDFVVLVLIFFSSFGPAVFLLLSPHPFASKAPNTWDAVLENCPDPSVKLIIVYIISHFHSAFFFFFPPFTYAHTSALTTLFQILCAFFGYHLLETVSHLPAFPLHTLSWKLISEDEPKWCILSSQWKRQRRMTSNENKDV